ncbi:GDSL-type esterase/lipase family protein [Bacillus marinisedimentorum]|uniref:GDSL-type esterase/lipase family protein n=1 Tax=Bacillus marinisedimentorum TaxID=1821260 RepID=UPI0007DF9608|nr:GDSL-type esterase/lipase family protein [Bacillus marinisedimentorum]
MKKMVCFGDSITAREKAEDGRLRLTPRLRKEFPEWKVLNRGVPGNTTRDASRRFEKDVLKENPDLVTILFGANDSATHRLVPLNEYRKNLMHFTAEIGSGKVLLISPAPVVEKKQPNRSNARLLEYRNAVMDTARKKGAAFLDLHMIMTEEDYGQFLVEDGLHFNEKGYRFLSGLVSEAVINWQIDQYEQDQANDRRFSGKLAGMLKSFF